MNDLKYLILEKNDLNEDIFDQIFDVEENSGGEPYSKESLKSIVYFENSKNYVCIDNGKVVAVLTANFKSKKFGGSIYIVNLSVHKEFHRRGIATALFNIFYDDCKHQIDNKIISIDVDKTNLPAIALYKKLGFEFVSYYEDDEQYGMILPINEKFSNKNL